jgi:hypothetical protein
VDEVIIDKRDAVIEEEKVSTIVEDESPAFFAHDVQELVEEGFKLHGGMTVDGGKYYQALIKNEAYGGGGKTRKRRAQKKRKTRRTRK